MLLSFHMWIHYQRTYTVIAAGYWPTGLTCQEFIVSLVVRRDEAGIALSVPFTRRGAKISCSQFTNQLSTLHGHIS